MYRVLVIFTIYISWLFSSFAQGKEQTVRVVTESAFPLQYQEDGTIVGPATELLEALLKEAKVSYQIEMQPWARAYQSALTNKNTLIYSIARTPEREQNFHWLGEVMSLDYYLFGLAGDSEEITEQALIDARIGVIRDSATSEYLTSQGYKNLQVVSHPKQSIKMLLSERIDYFPANIASFNVSCRNFELDCDKIKAIYKLKIPATKLYFAFSKSTDKALVDKVKLAYKKMQPSYVNQSLVLKSVKPSSAVTIN